MELHTKEQMMKNYNDFSIHIFLILFTFELYLLFNALKFEG